MKDFVKLFGFWLIVFTLLSLILTGCAKTASETATDAALAQTEAITQIIKKECPTAKINEHMASLKTMIKTQLSTCEVEKGQLRERNNTLLVILVGILVVFGVSKLAKGGVL